ncbi:MAG: bifunctional diguanylate cyclase/phosphodiesterase [Sulfurimonas sp.]|uniref:bifunctional diguanylate cyclase/phosphodiesterase n=1 Tax=Sulfurimonas sp. TaxID=2022749 RepID=UPI0025FBE536|nr:bifunctional diguanylate cyclase/phosphodiesterase [Sulfurimonas sp.]MCK9491815.1 bifunctional diguanylate cyclase/phosphodiesterase [Sulfurimonas sp.]
MKNKQRSVFYTLFLAISFTILVAIFIVSTILYNQTKDRLLKDINSDVQTSLTLLKNSIYPFMDSYSVHEYEKLIANELNRKYTLAIVVEDCNMAKILDSKYLVGKINNDKQVQDFDQNNKIHQQRIDNSYLYIKDDIYNQNGLKLGNIAIYASDSLVQEKLESIITISIIITLLSTIIVLLVIYFVMHQIVQKPVNSIIEVLNNKTDDGIPTSTIPSYNSKELSILSSTLNNMINSIKESRYQLDKIANTDTLTNLGNRYKLIQDINHSTNPALAIINIDNFSELNDFYGYEVGDYIIKQVGQHISGVTRHKNTFTYHIQGDEYVLFNHDIDKNEFERNIHKLVDIFSNITVEVDEEDLNFNFTIGVSFESKEKILPTADMALKVAKRNNENIMVFSEAISLNKEYENNIYWTKKIRTAIFEDSFIPVYQPIINNNTNKIEKYESLVRMRDQDKLISPFFFLEISKKTKYYSTITKIMIEKTFERFKDSDLEFSINLTIEDILNTEIKEYIYGMLIKHNIATRVVFEIVETESIENFEAVLGFINKIKKIGSKIAIDDFGTGYSNFDYLMRLNADYIKIDGSLIKEIDTNKQAQAVVSTIVDFAKRMNIKTIAEFVENEDIQKKVMELGIDYSQGYYFSEPKIDI